MSEWKTWLENRQREERHKKIQEIWGDTFKALGIGGLSDEDAAHQSLSHIHFNNHKGDGGGESTFRGKQAALKRLENGQIFARLQQLGDPEIVKQIEDTKAWLGHSDEKHANAESNASTTVSTLLQKLFGSHFQQLIDADFPEVGDDAQAQVEPQPPMDNLGPSGPNPEGEPQADPSQQPQVAPVAQPPMPAPVQGQMPNQMPQGQPMMAHNQGNFGRWLAERNLR